MSFLVALTSFLSFSRLDFAGAMVVGFGVVEVEENVVGLEECRGVCWGVVRCLDDIRVWALSSTEAV